VLSACPNGLLLLLGVDMLWGRYDTTNVDTTASLLLSSVFCECDLLSPFRGLLLIIISVPWLTSRTDVS